MASLKRLLIVTTRPETGRLGAAPPTAHDPSFIADLRALTRQEAICTTVALVIALTAGGALAWGDFGGGGKFFVLAILLVGVLASVCFARRWAQAKLLLALLPELDPPLAETVSKILVSRLR